MFSTFILPYTTPLLSGCLYGVMEAAVSTSGRDAAAAHARCAAEHCNIREHERTDETSTLTSWSFRQCRLAGQRQGQRQQRWRTPWTFYLAAALIALAALRTTGWWFSDPRQCWPMHEELPMPVTLQRVSFAASVWQPVQHQHASSKEASITRAKQRLIHKAPGIGRSKPVASNAYGARGMECDHSTSRVWLPSDPSLTCAAACARWIDSLTHSICIDLVLL
jgi:hypothetical protein